VVVDELKRLGLIKGRGKQTDVLRLCHAQRLVGGLSMSLRATPDEVVGPLTFATGAKLRVLDVRDGPPMVLEIQSGELTEKWEVDGISGLIHNLNDLYRAEPLIRAVAVLGEFEDMLQVWCIEKAALPQLLRRRVLDGASNVQTLWAISDGSADEPDR
jgi:hypothetical protein